MTTFQALIARKGTSGVTVALENVPMTDLMPGDTLVRVTHSTINYKDGLAMLGLNKVVPRYPLIPGLDLAGVVEETTHPALRVGERVILNGRGSGTSRHGGYAQFARVLGDDLIPCPPAFTNAQAMAVGIAGYTAMLCVMRLEAHGITPDSGPVLVTGAAGGVGSVAIALLSHLGHEVDALSGRPELADYLMSLGARRVLPRAALGGDIRALEHARWAAAVDVVGGPILAHAIASIRPTGIVAACGLAGGMDLPTNVAPFILRAVTLAGINCADVPRTRQIAAWDRLARDLLPARLAAMTTHVSLAQTPAFAQKIVAGAVRGRLVVDIPSPRPDEPAAAGIKGLE